MRIFYEYFNLPTQNIPRLQFWVFFYQRHCVVAHRGRVNLMTFHGIIIVSRTIVWTRALQRNWGLDFWDGNLLYIPLSTKILLILGLTMPALWLFKPGCGRIGLSRTLLLSLPSIPSDLLGIVVLLKNKGLFTLFVNKSREAHFPTDKCFWFFAKILSNNFFYSNFSSLTCFDGSVACSSLEKANLFGSLFFCKFSSQWFQCTWSSNTNFF